MMAVDLHNFELLLPSDQFFTSQDHMFNGLSLEKNNKKPINQNASYYLFSSYDYGSELSSSPTGSDQLSSNLTESSEEGDDFIGELTRQMAQYMLPYEDKHEKSWGLSGSPESTMWSQLGSNLNSPVGPSREPFPPLTPMVGNFEKMKINEETARYNQGDRFTSKSTSIQVSGRNLSTGFQSKQALIDDQIRAIQFHRLRQERAMKQMEQKPRAKHYYQTKGRVFNGFNNGQKAPPNTNNPSYNLQHQQQQSNQQAGSDMRAVFLNASGSRKGSCGTGVFLPRGIGTPPESRKKEGCATVLIPARVVQALKLHFEKTGVPSRSNNGGFPRQYDAYVSGRNSMYSQQKGQSRTVLPAMNHQEMGLHQEWTLK